MTNRSRMVAALRQQMETFEAEPLPVERDPVAAFYADPPGEPRPPIMIHPPIPTGGYPIDYGWAEEAHHLQALSGEDPQC